MTTMMKRLAMTGLLAIAACGSRYDSLQLERVAGDEAARGNDDGFSVTEGRAVVYEVKPLANDQHRDYDALDELQLRTADPRIARFERGVAVDTWMLIGVSAGETEVHVEINGRTQDTLLVSVRPQEGF